MNSLNDMRQKRIEWDCGTTGIGVIESDSLMFQRGEPSPGDPHLSEVYGLALPLLKRGMPVTPVQLENVIVPRYLTDFRVLLLTYHGMKPLSPEVHTALADWVKRGGALVVFDDDSDPYHAVRDWWNSDGRRYATPREHLFEQLGFNGVGAGTNTAMPVVWRYGKGGVTWLRQSPVGLAQSGDGDERVVPRLRAAAKRAKLPWRETNYLLLRRGPYLITAGLDESIAGSPKQLHGRFVNLFDPDLRVQSTIELKPGSRYLLRELTTERSRQPRVLAAACKVLLVKQDDRAVAYAVEGVGKTSAVLLLHTPKPPRAITLAGKPVSQFQYSAKDKLLWVRFSNEARQRELKLEW